MKLHYSSLVFSYSGKSTSQMISDEHDLLQVNIFSFSHKKQLTRFITIRWLHGNKRQKLSVSHRKELRG